MSKKKTKAILLTIDVILAAILIVLDQIIKSKVVEVFTADPSEKKFIPGVIYLIYLKNTGAAFSSFQNQKWLLVLISVVFMAILAFVVFKLPVAKKFVPANVLFAMVIAGGIGNMIDRIKQSYVVDYLGFDFWRSYPIFNFADICVVLGVVGLFILFLFVYKEKDLEFIRFKKSSKTSSEKDEKADDEAEKKDAETIESEDTEEE